MVYSDSTNKDGIIQMIEKTTSLGDGNISGNSEQLAYFNNLINQWYRVLALFAWKTDSLWVFDDTNQTTFPRYTTDIVDEQNDYELPAEALHIRQVEIKNSDGKWNSIYFIPEDSPLLRHDKEQEDPSIPIRYRLNGNSLILDPKPDTSQLTASSGLRVTVDREVDSFDTSDTTKEPGIPDAFHPVLYYGPSFEYAAIKGLDRVVDLCQRMLGNFEGLTDMYKDFYAQRNKDQKLAIKRARKNYK